MQYRNKPRFGEKPVKEGTTYDLEIEGIGSKGDGIGKIQGFVIIVPGAKKGEKVKVKINAVRGKVAFAEKVGAAEASEESAEESQESGETSEDSADESEETSTDETSEESADEAESDFEAETEDEE